MAKNSNPLVSVLMTSFNREKYIAISIKSVLDSSFKDFELIILDDGSTDNTLKIANSFAELDNRVRVYRNEKNLGDYPNRNKAASYAIGKYLKYVDSDDLIYPWGLEILVSTMEKFPEASWGLCSQPQDKNKIYPFVLTPEMAYKSHYFGLGIFSRAPLSSIIKNSVFKEVNGFSGKKHLGDFELWNILALKFNVVVLPQGMVWYREHDQQQMNENRQDLTVNFKYLIATINHFKYNEEIPLSKELKKKVLVSHHFSAISSIMKCLLKLKFRTSFKLLRMYLFCKIRLGVND